MLENGQEKCSCVRKKCERFGNCAACIEHHKTHKRYPLPYCMRKNKSNERRESRAARRKEE